jgi:Spy/CpxP family protein refolding chaperone
MSVSARTASFGIAALVLSGSLAMAQTAPSQPPPSAAPAPAAPQAPPPPQMHRGMPPMPQGEMHGPMGHGDFHGSPEERFHGDGRGGDHGRAEMGGFHMGPGGMWWKNPRIVERLSLTADQTKKMDDIVEHSRLDLIDLRANLEKQQVLLGPIMDTNPVDTAKASAQIDKVANARADLEKANAKMLLSIRGVLTPDQWTKLHERPSRETQPAPGAVPGASAAPAPGGGHWHGGRPGGPGGMDNVVPPVETQ